MPQALAAAPVFGGGAPAGEAPLAAGARPLGRILRPVGRVLRSRSAAYVVAAACIALAIGVAFHQEGVRQFVLTESVGPAIRLVIAPPAEARQRAKDPKALKASARPSPSGSQAAAGLVLGSQPLDVGAQLPEVVSQPAVLTPSGDDAPAGERERDSDTGTESAPVDVSVASVSSPAAEGGTAMAVRPVAKSRQEGIKHDGHRARPERATHGGGLHSRVAAGVQKAPASHSHRPSGRTSGVHASHGSPSGRTSGVHASHDGSHRVQVARLRALAEQGSQAPQEGPLKDIRRDG